MNKLTLNRNTYIKYLATHLANEKGDDKLKKIYKLIVFAILQMSPLYYKYYICTNCLFRNIVELLHMSLRRGLLMSLSCAISLSRFRRSKHFSVGKNIYITKRWLFICNLTYVIVLSTLITPKEVKNN